MRRSARLPEGWERDGERLFLAPKIYGEALLIQYLVSRSQAHGGMTLEGRLTLMDLIRRLRYSGYLDQIGITEHDPGEIFEKLIDHLASTSDWSRVSIPTSRGSGRVIGSKKTTKKAGKKSAKSRKSKTAAPPEPDQTIVELVKLHYIIDRRDFLEKVKSVYAAYAS